MRHRWRVRALAGGLLAAGFSLVGCASLPVLDSRVPSTVLSDTAGTQLGLVVAGGAAGKGGASGIYTLQRPRDAFAARVVLARMAERSLDVQYYIWHGDTTGFLLFEELWNAAERGVRVRLLLDDNNTRGLDETIAALDSHTGIEVRLFNPFPHRGSRTVGYLADFDRLNRRMHNKSFTADGQITIVGGRNVGDEYFAAGDGTVFSDLDVAGAGPVAAEAGSAFDRYWNCVSAYPAGLIVDKATPEGVARLKEKFAAVRASADAAQYLEEVRSTPLAGKLREGRVAFTWVPVRLTCDDPAKVLGEQPEHDLVSAELRPMLLSAQREVDIVSPYFVPGKRGTADLVGLARRGVGVRVLTNSLAATDVGAVHAGYAKRRRTLLGGGVRLYEMKPDAGAAAAKARSRAERREADSSTGGSSGGSSETSLHSKTFAVDRSRIFVGSYNFDPRSARLNTEMGMIIDHPALAAELSDAFGGEVPLVSYEVVLGADGESLEWIERTPAGETRHPAEPQTGFFRALGIGILSLLPIDGML